LEKADKEKIMKKANLWFIGGVIALTFLVGVTPVSAQKKPVSSSATQKKEKIRPVLERMEKLDAQVDIRAAIKFTSKQKNKLTAIFEKDDEQLDSTTDSLMEKMIRDLEPTLMQILASKYGNQLSEIEKFPEEEQEKAVIDLMRPILLEMIPPRLDKLKPQVVERYVVP
jgi:hypothetical protein